MITDKKPEVKEDLKSLSLPELEKKLESSPEGLTQAEAEKRLAQYGPNELTEKETSPLLQFLSYFWGPIPWMIEAAVILSAMAQHWADFFIILILLLSNAVVGFWEEHQAGNAIAALKAKLAIKTRVKRDGKWVTPAARALVPGDVIRVRLGDIVPADARLLEGDPIEVDQSALTGESLPATCKAGEAVFSGSIIRQGEIDAMVYATGANTYFGKTAQLVQEEQWQFLGVLPLFDPPREQAKETIATARQMGVNVKMVTGDALAIARETAGNLGLGANILDASGFGKTKQYETGQLAESIEKADGFAQVFPEHKFHIVEVLQQRAHIVGMTGDGVNDAPALKKADCGIVVSDATDAARAAADIVLMTPGLSVIIDAIKESRKIFQRMNSYAIYRIAETLRVLLFMTLAILIFNFYPLTAVMIVMLALLNDGAILSIAYDNVHFKDKPEAWDMRLVLGISTVLGVVGPMASFGLFYLAENVYQLDRPHIQSLMYLMLSVAGHLTIFQARTRGPFWSIRPARILWVAVLGTQILATLIAVYGLFMTPLGWSWALFVWGYALAWFVVTDRIKLLAYRVFDPTAAPLLEKNSDGVSR